MKEVLPAILLITSILVVSWAYQQRSEGHAVGMDRLFTDTQGIRDHVPPSGSISVIMTKTDSAASLRFFLMLRYVLAPRTVALARQTNDTVLYVFERMGTKEQYYQWANKRKVLYAKRTGTGALILTCDNK